MNDIRDAQERTEATLQSVTEMSNRLETSVAEITVELNKLETAFGSTKMAMEDHRRNERYGSKVTDNDKAVGGMR